jgi:hypothetical protein
LLPVNRRSRVVSTKNGNSNGNVLPYGLAAIGLLGGAMSFVWAQINPKMDIGAVESRLSEQFKQSEFRQRDINAALIKDIDEVKHTLEKLLTKEVHVEFAGKSKDITDRLQIEIDRITNDMVTRSEHKQHWDAQNERVNGVREQVIELRRDITGSANIGKQFETLQAQMKADRDDFRAQLLELQRRYEMHMSPQVVAPNATIKTPP